MNLEIRLIGEPSVIRLDVEPYRPRSRKTWALLCYLLLSEVPPSRRQLSSLLFIRFADPSQGSQIIEVSNQVFAPIPTTNTGDVVFDLCFHRLFTS